MQGWNHVTLPTFRLPGMVDRAVVLDALENRVPILRHRPRLEVVKGDVGELTTERRSIEREADTLKPLVHLGAVFTHALPDDVQRDWK